MICTPKPVPYAPSPQPTLSCTSYPPLPPTGVPASTTTYSIVAVFLIVLGIALVWSVWRLTR